MTRDQAERTVFNWIVRSYQTVSLAKKKDRDTYDVLYNVAKDLSQVDYSYVRALQDFATKCKQTLYDSKVLDFAKDLDFEIVESKVLEVYSEAIIKFFQRELGLSSYDARQLWLKLDAEAMRYLGLR